MTTDDVIQDEDTQSEATTTSEAITEVEEEVMVTQEVQEESVEVNDVSNEERFEASSFFHQGSSSKQATYM